MKSFRVRHFQPYNQSLKSGLACVENAANTTVSYIQKRSTKPSIQVSGFIKFDEPDFDGVHVLVTVEANDKPTSIKSCVVDLYEVSKGGDWTLTSIGQKTLVANGIGFSASYPSDELPTLMAETTLYMVAKVERLDKVYTFKGFFNHLGALEFMTRNKKKIQLLDLLKADS